MSSEAQEAQIQAFDFEPKGHISGDRECEECSDASSEPWSFHYPRPCSRCSDGLIHVDMEYNDVEWTSWQIYCCDRCDNDGWK